MRTQTFKVLVVLFCFAFSTHQAQEVGVALEFENATTARELVHNYVLALQEGNVEKMNAQLADNAMIYGLGGAMDSLNVTQHKEYYENSTAKYNHVVTQDLYLPVKVTNNWNAGEWLLTWGVNTVTNKKTGISITIPYHTANLVENGKIVMCRYYYDVLNIIETEGFAITPPSK